MKPEEVEQLLLVDVVSPGSAIYDAPPKSLTFADCVTTYKVMPAKAKRAIVPCPTMSAAASANLIGSMLRKVAKVIPGWVAAPDIWDDAGKRIKEPYRMVRGSENPERKTRSTSFLMPHEIMVVGLPWEIGRLVRHGRRRGALVFSDAPVLVYRAKVVNRFDKVVNGVLEFDADVRPVRRLRASSSAAPTLG